MSENLLPKLSEDTQKELLAFINKRHNLMRDKRKDKDADVKRWLDLYNSIAEEKDYDWESNLFVPYVYSMLQTALPRVNASLFGSNQKVSVEAQTEEFVHSENKIAKYIDQKLNQMKLRKKARDINSASLKYPYAVAKVRWRFETDTYRVKEYPKIFGKPIKVFGPQDVEKSSVTYDDPDFEHIPWDEFWIDPDATCIENARDCIHRTIKDYNHLKIKEAEGIYMNVEKLKDSKPPIDVDLFVKEAVDGDYYDQTDKGYNEVEVKEWYGAYDINGTGELEHIIVFIGNGKNILRVVENDNYRKMKPFKLFRAFPEEGSIYGKCLPQILESLQNELNDVRNARMDNIKLVLRKTYKVLSDADIDLGQLFSGPGNVIFMDNMDDVQEMEFKNIISAMEEGNIKNDMQQVSKITDYNMGTSGGRGINSTATGISIITAETASGFKEMVENLKDDYIELIDMMFIMMKQEKTDDEVLRLYERGESKFDKVTLEELQGDYYFRINLKSLSANKQLEQQQYVNLLNILGRFPNINVRALIRTILEKFEVKNIEEIMNVQQMQQQMQQQQMQQQSGNAGMMDGLEQPGMPSEAEKTPEQRINEVGTLNSPVDSTLKQPIKQIPELETLNRLQKIA